jgi:tetraacyldisaccharide 4'-kinase
MGYKPSAQFDIPLISVGNLAVGGTGKTPMIEYLVRLLTPQYKVATLSRGYGRATKGVRIAGQNDDASTIGDEPYQFYKNFNTKITVAVGEERALAIPYIIDQHGDTQVILLDDAFQHRKVKPAFQILLTDCSNPFYHDLLLPAGRLRESRKGVSRADVIIVTKCPQDISEDAMMDMEKMVREYADKPIFFTTIRYGNPIAISQTLAPKENVILLSGIANSKPFEGYAKKNYRVLKHDSFPDHHVYTTDEVQAICELAEKQNAMILTTEKDATKLESEKFHSILKAVPCFYLPIEMDFLKSGKDFDEMIFNVLRQQHVS